MKKYNEGMYDHLPSLGPANKNLDAAIDALVGELQAKIKEAIPTYAPTGFFGKLRNWWKDNVRRGEAIKAGRAIDPVDPEYIYGKKADFGGGYDAEVKRRDAMLADKAKKDAMWAKLGQRESVDNDDMPMELWNLYNEHIDEIVRLVTEAVPHPIDDPTSDGGFNSHHYEQPAEAPKINPQQALGMYLAQFKDKIKDLVMQYRSNRYLTHGAGKSVKLDSGRVWTEPQRPAGGGHNPEWDAWAREWYYQNTKDSATPEQKKMAQQSGYKYVPGILPNKKKNIKGYAHYRDGNLDPETSNNAVENELGHRPTKVRRKTVPAATSATTPPNPTHADIPPTRDEDAPLRDRVPKPETPATSATPIPDEHGYTPDPKPSGAPGIGKTEDEITDLLSYTDDVTPEDAKERVQKLVPKVNDMEGADKVPDADWKELLNQLKAVVALVADSVPDDLHHCLNDTVEQWIKHYYTDGSVDGMVDHHLNNLRNSTIEGIKLRGLKPADKVKYLKELMAE